MTDTGAIGVLNRGGTGSDLCLKERALAAAEEQTRGLAGWLS